MVPSYHQEVEHQKKNILRNLNFKESLTQGFRIWELSKNKIVCLYRVTIDYKNKIIIVWI